jgi:deoxycytidylate deaminase
MKNDNPMKRLYSSTILNNEKVSSLVERQKEGQRKLERKLFDYADRLELETGFRAIVVGHTRHIPDIVLIDWDKRRVVAVEHERMEKNVKLDKYGDNSQYNDVIWHVEQRWDDAEIYDGFACLPVKSIDIIERDTPIYNLEVEEDNSFVCQNIVVHNCLHAEDNALLKMDYNASDRTRMLCTTLPCLMCSKRIVNAGISEVVYLNEYRKTEGKELLAQAGIRIWKFIEETDEQICQWRPPFTDGTGRTL